MNAESFAPEIRQIARDRLMESLRVDPQEDAIRDVCELAVDTLDTKQMKVFEAIIPLVRRGLQHGAPYEFMFTDLMLVIHAFHNDAS